MQHSADITLFIEGPYFILTYSPCRDISPPFVYNFLEGESKPICLQNEDHEPAAFIAENSRMDVIFSERKVH